MEEIKYLTTIDEIKAIADPYRYRIINCFNSLEVPATVKQIADRLGEVPAKVHYHVKVLERLGFLVLHHTEEINGIIAKYYELTARHFEVKYDQDDVIAKGLVLSEVQKAVAKLYSGSKDVFFDVLEKHKNNREVIKGVFSTQEVFLTKDQAEAVCQYITQFAEENKERDSNNKKQYHYFFTLFNMEA